MDIPGLDPDRNSQMDIFPTNILQNIVVLKTLTADLPADFSGGFVNIELVDFPTKKTLNISSSLGYTPGMHLIQGLGHQGSITDFLGFDSGFRTNPLPNQYIYSGIPNPCFGRPNNHRAYPKLRSCSGGAIEIDARKWLIRHKRR